MSNCGLTKLRKYRSRYRYSRNAITTKVVGYVWNSKNSRYEIPYTIKGGIKHTGSQELPKGICKDKVIGTW